MKILMLTNAANSISVKLLKKEAEKRGHDVETFDPTDLVAFISSTVSGHDQMFVKDTHSEIQRLYSKQFDVVLARFSGRDVFQYGLAMLQHFNGNLKIPVSSDPLALSIAANKFTSHQCFSLAKVRTIPTLFVNKPVDFSFIVKKLGLPLVCKTPLGSQGSGVFILSNELSISTTLSAFSRTNRNLLLQKFIDSGKPSSDLRIFIVDGEIVASYRRWALDSDFRSNYSLSHLGEKVELTAEEEEMALAAAYSVGLPGICGVDLVRDSNDNNKPYIIETNGNPSLEGVTKVTGVNVAEKIIIYLERIARKTSSQTKDTKKAENQLNFFVKNHQIQPGTLEYVNLLARQGSTNEAISELKRIAL